MLRLFVNTLTTDDKYSLLNRDNLTQPIQTQLSQKQKANLNIFFSCFNPFPTNILFNPSHPVPGRSENIKSNCIFTPLCGASKGFKRAFKAVVKLLRHHKEV